MSERKKKKLIRKHSYLIQDERNLKREKVFKEAMATINYGEGVCKRQLHPGLRN